MATTGGGSDYDFLIKLILIGDTAVGKTNLLLRFTRNKFLVNTQTTIGVEFAERELKIDGKIIKSQVWDTAGHERFKTIVPQLYRGSDGVFVVFDLTEPETFANVRKWIEEVKRHAPHDSPIVLIGNKSDLVSERKIKLEQAKILAEQLNLSYMETSALNASNVEQAFTTLITNIYHKKKLQVVHISPVPALGGHRYTPGIPISSDATVEITPNPLRLTDNQESTTSKKSGCC